MNIFNFIHHSLLSLHHSPLSIPHPPLSIHHYLIIHFKFNFPFFHQFLQDTFAIVDSNHINIHLMANHLYLRHVLFWKC